jgi:DNA polymerase III alpha subunit
VETWRRLVRVRNELRYLDMHITDHPMRVLREEAARAGCLPTSELAGHVGETVSVAGVVAASRRRMTGGGAMQFVTIEDEHDLIEAVIHPGVYSSLGDPISNPGPFIFRAVVEEDHGDVTLRVVGTLPFHLRSRPFGQESVAR